LNLPVFDLLVVSWPGPLPGPRGFDSEIAGFRIVFCDGLGAVVPALSAQRVDAVLIGTRGEELETLAAWPSLAALVVDTPVVVATADAPDAATALRLVAEGVQDVVELGPHPPSAALRRTLRFALERHARERAARKATSTDLLTGLPNQSQLTEHISQLLALRERAPAPMVVLALRLDGLVRAEAHFGREATNALRRKIAVRLRAAMRAGDVVASTATDRFAVLLPHVHSADDGARVAEKLTAALQVPLGLAGRQVAVSVAIGVAQYPRDGKDAAALLRIATDMAAQVPPRASPEAGAHRNPRAEAANDD
jgi:diguanylate cyclase (GGDEF)-like protein